MSAYPNSPLLMPRSRWQSMNCGIIRRNIMSTNQPAQPTAATQFLKHTALSFGVGILFAVIAAIGNYIYTAGNAIDIKIVATVAGGAFLAYLLSHFNSDIKPNWPQIEQGLNDVI